MSKITFVLSDDSIINNQGFRLMTDGADLSQFEKNPVMFLLHNDCMLPIGRWLDIRKEGSKILADAEFDEADDDPEVKRAIGKVKRGYIKMASIGSWPPSEWSTDAAMMLPGQEYPTATKWMAREASIVPIGGNNNAMVVRLYDAKGEDTGIISLADKVTSFTKPKIMSKKLLGILNLQDDAGEDMIVGAVEAILQTNKTLLQERDSAIQLKDTLTNELKTFKDAEKIALIDQAIVDKKFGEDMRATYLELYDANPTSTKSIIEKMPKVTRVADDLNGESGFQMSDEQKAWTIRDWDKKGLMLKLKDGDPETYKRLFKEEYGVEPK